MRGDLTISILENLMDSAQTAGDLLEVFLTSPYGTSFRGFEYRMRQIEGKRAPYRVKIEGDRRARQMFHTMVYNLKHQGFIKEDEAKGVLRVTRKGFEKLKKLIQRLPSPSAYPAESGNELVIVAFDVPEKEKKKREWLRAVLANMKLDPVQKSLWMGKIKIPREFLEDLDRLKLVPCVQIFKITRTGSLASLS